MTVGEEDRRMTNDEFRRVLEERTKRFAVALLNWLATLPGNRVVGATVYQLAKSGPSVGANYREANKAESPNDFAHKIGIVEKEANETVFWLEVLLETKLLDSEQKAGGAPLLSEAAELLKLFSSISRTSRANKNKPKS
jgi:four helix bundle protein